MSHPAHPLRISDDRRYLQQADGRPFFWLGDTAWELFHRLSLDEARRYLDVRARQGFTVVQAVVLAELDGVRTPNANGDLPLIDADPTRPNEPYFAHVDAILAEAAARGIVVALLPTWGDKVNRKWGAGPEILTPQNARPFGAYLGKRYENAGIVWMLGGDRPLESDDHLRTYREMAEGIREGGAAQLMTFHPSGGASSSDYVHGEPWLDFHSLQSGHHARYLPNWEMLGRDYGLQPVRPILDSEPSYEDHPIAWKPEEEGYFTDQQVRTQLYWAVFAGGIGLTYGCHPIWQMLDAGREPVGFARRPWHEALELPVANQVKHLRDLIEHRSFFTRIPDQTILLSPPGRGEDRLQATRCREGSFALVHTSQGRPFTVRLDWARGGKVRAAWFDPRTGESTLVGEIETADPHPFKAPSTGLDWVLTLDAA